MRWTAIARNFALSAFGLSSGELPETAPRCFCLKESRLQTRPSRLCETFSEGARRA